MSGRSKGPSLPERHNPQDEEGSRHHFGSFKLYMQYKNEKLQEQFEQLGQEQQRSNLFAGISIHVNGYTQPSHQELKQLMAMHGGKFQNYYSRATVTHIICSNLADTKVKQYEKERSPTPVVRPEWIVDSLQAGRVLPIQDYTLWRLRDAPGQRTLKGFQQLGTAALPPTAIYGDAVASAVKQQQAQQQAQQQQDKAHQAQVLQQGEAHQAQVQQQQVSYADPAAQPSPHAEPVPARPASAGSNPPLGAAEQQQQQQQEQQPARQPRATTPHSKYSGGVAGSCYDAARLEEAQRLAAQMRAACDLLRGAPKSTKDDPQFMASFFQASRLHFIGSWKARIESLMATKPNDAPAPAPIVFGRPSQRSIIHIDMDCFFASVTEASNPVFKGLPLAVCHSASAKGTGEVSSANYEARRYGVAASMFISRAKELCPHLIVVPYEFDKYEEASEQVYRILLKHTACVQPISCDEAFVDVTGLGDPQEVASRMRAEIQAATGCTASAGIGPNMLLARLATKRAKPNGQFCVTAAQARSFLAALPVESLPGVGWATEQKLKDAGIERVSDIQGRSKQSLQQLLGSKSGEVLWEHAQGRDSRVVEPPKARKSVGAEVNWGVRFSGDEEAEKFLDDLAAEVHQRLRAAGVKGRTITLKLKRRKEGAVEPIKFMGHGICDNLSRSVTLACFTDSTEELGRTARGLLRALKVPADQIRGLGLAVGRLDNDAASASAKPNAPPPAKLVAPPASRFDPDAPHPWAAAFNKAQGQQEDEQPEGLAQQQHQRQQQQGEGEGGEASAEGIEGEGPLVEEEVQEEEEECIVQAGSALRQAVQAGSALRQAVQAEHMEMGDSGSGREGGVATTSPADQQQQQQAAPPGKQHPGEQGSSPQQQQQQVMSVEERQRLLARFQGATLTQIDASQLAELPWSLQKQLLETLPRGGGSAPGAGAQQSGGKQPAGTAAAGAASAAGAAGTAGGAEASNQEQQQQQEEEEEQEGSDEVREARATGPVAAQRQSPPAAAMDRPATRSCPQEQAAASSDGGGTNAAAERRGKERRSDSPIQALPAFSQLDPTVLDALPLALKRELEVAYGIGRPQTSPQKQKRGRAHAAHHPSRPAPKRQRLASFLSHDSKGPQGRTLQHRGTTTAGQEAAAAGSSQAEAEPLQQPAARQQLGSSGSGSGSSSMAASIAPSSLSQVDPTVLEQLPWDLQKEVLAQLAPGGRGGRKRRREAAGPSRLGQVSLQQANPGREVAARGPGRVRHSPRAGASGGGQAREGPGGLWEGADERLGEGNGQGCLLACLPEPLRRWMEEMGQPCSAGGARLLGSLLSSCLQELEEQEQQEQPQQQEQQHEGGSGGTDGNQQPGDRGSGPAAAAGAEPGATGSGRLGGAAASGAPSSDVLEALCWGLVTGCSSLVQGRLDEVKAALKEVQQLGERYPWFAEPAWRVVHSVQAEVQREHGWKLRLGSWLEE